ncbi:alpha-hydroxy-acid oxidizing enzyme [Halobacteriales archaeon QS_4_69_34]|nr:MAG: alpha-hydroxy-acid oxidizing enzyme [Halobacteriales archaeon QS_4_69_34]
MFDDGSAPDGRDRIKEIFASGTLADEPPELPVSFDELAARAHEAMSPEARAYVPGGAGAERTMDANERAFDRWRIVPRMCRDVSTRDLSVELFGREFAAPVALAPIGCQSLLDADGELATARAAAEQNVPMTLSSVSSRSIEDVGEALGDVPKWFQLYWGSDDAIARSFVERAEAAGYDAIVLTVDTPVTGWRERELREGYSPYLDGEGLANYVSDPAFRERLDQPPEENPGAAAMEFVDVFGDASHTFADVATLREWTDLPVVLKGILHPADAEAAIEAGADGIVVSNHGGRQVDGSIGALEALPGVVDAVDGRLPVLFDSGIRGGADALKAIALGAEVVLYGRPYAYGLAIDGEDGVDAVLSNLLADLDVTLGLAGHASIAEVDRSALVHTAEL